MKAGCSEDMFENRKVRICLIVAYAGCVERVPFVKMLVRQLSFVSLISA
jgi:uncharacterized Fe-S cluster-containing protein